jgi:hypothetical protein
MADSVEVQKFTSVLDVDYRTFINDMKSAFGKAEREAEDSSNKINKTLSRIGSDFGKGFSAGLNALSGDFGEAIDLATGLTPASLKLIPVVGSGLSAAFDKSSGAMLSLVNKGLAFDDMMKRSRISFTALAGDERAARREMDELSTVSARSEFGRSAIFAAARELQDMGRNAKQIPADILGMASAASVLSSSTAEAESRLARMASTFGRVLELGKVGSRDIKKLIGAGIPALDILVEETGLKRSTVEALLQKDLFEADKFVTAHTSGMQKRFGAGSEQVLHTLGVEQAKLNSGMASLSGKAFQNVYDTTATGIGGVNQLIRSDGRLQLVPHQRKTLSLRL